MDLKQLLDPEFQTAQAKFTNAQVAVNEAYRIARHFVTYEVRDETITDRDVYRNTTDAERATQLANFARKLAVEIQKDLDDTLSVLDKKEVKNGDTRKSTTLPKTS